MIDLPSLIDFATAELLPKLETLPDATTLLRQLQQILDHRQPVPWFPQVAMDAFLNALATIEECLLSHMTWENEPDPVVRAHARAQLRAALSTMTRQYAANIDRELQQLRSRQMALKGELDRQKALSDGLLRTRHAGVCVLDARGRVLAWSAGAEIVTNRSAADMLGTPIDALLPEVADLLERRLSDPSRAGSDEAPLEGTCPLEREPGMPPADLSFRLGILRRTPGPQNEAAVLSMWDVSELRALRARVDEGDRLQAMSRIAGSVAHEIRNPLNALFLNTDLLEIELEKEERTSPRIEHLLGIIRQEVDKVNDIVTDYLSLARLPDRQREALEMTDFVRNLAVECMTWWGEDANIRVMTRLDGGSHPVRADSKQLRRALFNVLQNARDAMPEGGVLELTLGTCEGEVELAIRDTGIGMGPEDLARVATPFFTRKEGGTGLGVYLAREIVAAHRGRLELESEAGHGTTVRIFLPAL